MSDCLTPFMAAHNEQPAEWWYYHGHLQTDGRQFGFHLAFFRRRTDEYVLAGFLPVRWLSKQARAAHFAIADHSAKSFRCTHRFTLGNDGGASSKRYELRMRDWFAREEAGCHHLKAGCGNCSLELTLEPLKPFVQIGDQGVFRKHRNVSAAYLTCTRLKALGRLTLQGRELDVDGSAWVDHEFGAFRLRTGFRGWDWFGLQLDDGRELLVYRIRDGRGRTTKYSGIAVIGTKGQVDRMPFELFQLRPLSFCRSPRTGYVYPASWMLQGAERPTRLILTPVLKCNEVDTRGSTNMIYWEGPVRVGGTFCGKEVGGLGFAELVGYESRTRLREVYDFTKGKLRLTRYLANEVYRLRARMGFVRTEDGWSTHEATSDQAIARFTND